MLIKLSKSDKPDKKYKVLIGNRTIHFGSAGMSDYTKHKDPVRKALYIKRHKAREKWGKNGIRTAGFWSKWLLWNKPTINESIRDIQKRFNVRIV